MSILGKSISDTTVIVSYYIAHESNRVKLNTYLIDEFNAKKKSESVFEFIEDFNDKRWDKFCKDIERIIDLKTDKVNLWSLVRTYVKNALFQKNEFRETEIGFIVNVTEHQFSPEKNNPISQL